MQLGSGGALSISMLILQRVLFNRTYLRTPPLRGTTGHRPLTVTTMRVRPKQRIPICNNAICKYSMCKNATWGWGSGDRKLSTLSAITWHVLVALKQENLRSPALKFGKPNSSDLMRQTHPRRAKLNRLGAPPLFLNPYDGTK